MSRRARLRACSASLVAAAIAAASSPHAARAASDPAGVDRIPSRSMLKAEEDSGPDTPQPVTFFGSLGSGYGLVAGPDYASAARGPHALLGVGAATQIARWELDAGASWFYSNVEGRGTGGERAHVRTRSGTIDLGARYRFKERWQAGPALNLTFGSDASFAPSFSSPRSAPLAGLKAVYEIPGEGLPLRFWTQVSASVLPGDRLYVGLMGFQLGIPVLARPQTQADTVVVSSAAPVPAPEREVRVVLDGQRIFFGTNSARLRKDVAQALREVGSHLSSARDGFGEVRVAGHADQRGRYAYNLKLSRERAKAVSQALAQGGLRDDDLRVEGFSYLHPLDKRHRREAWARNRRVEIVFEDVRDAESLRRLLAKLETEAPHDSKD